jgi:hypothetical protein
MSKASEKLNYAVRDFMNSVGNFHKELPAKMPQNQKSAVQQRQINIASLKGY